MLPVGLLSFPSKDLHLAHLVQQVFISTFTSLIPYLTNLKIGYKCSGVSLSNPDGVPEMCPVGTYSPVGVTACLSCTAGTYCNTAASAAPVACPDGYISADGAT